MTAADLLKSIDQAGISLNLGDNGRLRYSGEQAAIDRLLPTLRDHKTELIAALIAANDGVRHRLWLITRPDGSKISLSRNPPATLADIERDYSGCRVEPESEPAPGPALSPDVLALANAWLDSIEEDDEQGRAEYLEGLALNPGGIDWLSAECLRLGLARHEAPAESSSADELSQDKGFRYAPPFIAPRQTGGQP